MGAGGIRLRYRPGVQPHHRPSTPSLTHAPTAPCDNIRASTGAPMFVVVWQFEIAEEKIATLRPPMALRAPGRNSSAPRPTTAAPSSSAMPTSPLLPHHRPMASEEAFRAFRKDRDADYESLDRSCDSLTSAKPASAPTPSRHPTTPNQTCTGHHSTFSVSSPFSCVNGCLILLQSLRNLFSSPRISC